MNGLIKICSILNYQPQWELEEGLKQTIDWQKQFYKTTGKQPSFTRGERERLQTGKVIAG